MVRVIENAPFLPSPLSPLSIWENGYEEEKQPVMQTPGDRKPG
jgi:hypothetical protein